MPFIELSREIETLAGCSVREIHDLYGTTAYRRYERRALEEIVQIHSEVVIATPGGIVSDPATFNELLAHCTTVWLRAAPEEHMGRVLAQGDMRPMAASKEAMEDLRRILNGRPLLFKGDLTVTPRARPRPKPVAVAHGVRQLMANRPADARRVLPRGRPASPSSSNLLQKLHSLTAKNMHHDAHQ